MSEQEQNIQKKIKVLIILGTVCLLLFIFWEMLKFYTVTNVYVEGSTHYTATQIRQMVENGWFGDNTIMLSLKYHNKSIDDVPFVETMDVKVENRNTIRVIVYEKSLAGYVQYLDRYMYFDKDGIVVENAQVPTASLPMVTGLSFDHFVMYEALPVQNAEVFQTILDVTKMLEKYGISTDRIYFNESYEMALFFGNVRVELGSEELLEEKIQQLKAILTFLDLEEVGTIDLKSYKTDSPNVMYQEKQQN
ncbi:MAG: cell division protein FtsQ [Lachnospiraceae bacterium]|nr:cell division protein FtsQ [Lachnospiraceae bacterium]